MAATLARAGDLPVPRLALTSIAWRGIAGGALMLLAAQVVSALLPLVDGFFAARLPEGTLATLNFANRMVLGVQGLAALALQRVGLPLFSRLVASSPAQVLPAALRLAALMGMGALVIGGAVALLADPLVSLLFERGRFSAGDREQVATLLRWGMVQLVPFLSGLAIVTTLASSNAPGWLALAASAGLAVKITASALLFTTYGAAGLQVATALMYVVASLVAWIGLRHRLRNAVA
jgi:putative peptidoglycan lipid II flippase